MSEQKEIDKEKLAKFLKEFGDMICNECPLYKRFLREKQRGDKQK